ncbi:hypothetical protein ABPG77_002258 [Micractinium sp. CCAP 211/92]
MAPRMGLPGFCPLLVLFLAAGPVCCSAQQDLATLTSTGSSLEQAADGSWLQAVRLQAANSGLKDAFVRQLATVECPSSQAFDVILSYEHSDSGTSWQRLRRCGSGALGGDAAAYGPGCTLSAPAVVDSTLVIRQPGSLSDAGGIPEPCTLTVRSATSPQLITASLLGAALLVRGQRWCRSRPGSALIRTCCVGVPLLVAVAGTALLASMAVVSTAGIELLLAQLPVQPPKEMLGVAVAATAAVIGLITALSLVCACVALQVQGLAVAAAPWVSQLLGLVLICSNSQALNWAIRGACILWLLHASARHKREAGLRQPDASKAGEKRE